MIGLCGNCNGRWDDYWMKDGEDVFKNFKRYFLIGNSYIVKDDID